MTKTDSSDSEPEIIENNMYGTQRPPHIDYIEWVLQKIFEAFKNPGLSIKKLAAYIMENGGYKAFDSTAQWLIRHPFSGLIVIIAVILSLPFLFIVGLATSIAFITFTGFIFIEGTLLTFVSVLSFGCLGALAIVLLAIVVLIVSVYMGFAYIYDLYGNGEGIALARFLNKEKEKTKTSEFEVETLGSDFKNEIELNIAIKENNETILAFEDVQRVMSLMTKEEQASFHLAKYLDGKLLTNHQSAIYRIYKDKCLDIIESLKKNPSVAVPIVLRRFKNKEEEWRMLKNAFDKRKHAKNIENCNNRQQQSNIESIGSQQ